MSIEKAERLNARQLRFYYGVISVILRQRSPLQKIIRTPIYFQGSYYLHMVEFGVCKRTIENDIMHLSLKYPIYTKSGSGGGVFVLPNFKPDKPSMNKKQIDLLKKLALLLANEDRKTIIEIIEMYG